MRDDLEKLCDEYFLLEEERPENWKWFLSKVLNKIIALKPKISDFDEYVCRVCCTKCSDLEYLINQVAT